MTNMEPVETRLARIEEGLVHIHGRISNNHNEVMKALAPVKHHSKEITILKRDRFWVFSILTLGIGFAGYVIHLGHI